MPYFLSKVRGSGWFSIHSSEAGVVVSSTHRAVESGPDRREGVAVAVEKKIGMGWQVAFNSIDRDNLVRKGALRCGVDHSDSCPVMGGGSGWSSSTDLPTFRACIDGCVVSRARR